MLATLSLSFDANQAWDEAASRSIGPSGHIFKHRTLPSAEEIRRS